VHDQRLAGRRGRQPRPVGCHSIRDSRVRHEGHPGRSRRSLRWSWRRESSARERFRRFPFRRMAWRATVRGRRKTGNPSGPARRRVDRGCAFRPDVQIDTIDGTFSGDNELKPHAKRQSIGHRPSGQPSGQYRAQVASPPLQRHGPRKPMSDLISRGSNGPG
jgi:hypothetical protein